jgi:hypothetical protein
VSAAASRWVVIAVAAWVAAVGFGFWQVWAYKLTPGARADVPKSWPAATVIARANDRPTLLMIAHPRCSCTRASLSELNRLMNELGDRVRAFVVFADADDTPELLGRAREIPSTQVIVDRDGSQSAPFATTTSGHILLYDREGALMFSGGITPARGHEGDSFGRERILALMRGEPADHTDSPVFGCPLHDSSLHDTKEGQP